ncbi:MAG: DNA repair protein RecO [Verrucomicrobia bacterium]|nr:DNA repair protein RecO [Verrucomicrobiota bacterium]
MDEKATGIILRVRPLTETSLIIHWLTGEAGRIATVAKGARRPKSPFRGKLDLFFSAQFTFRRSSRSELHVLREVDILDSHPVLRTSMGYLNQAAYAAALIEQVTETETPIPELFQLVRDYLAYVSTRPNGPLPVFAFEMKLLNELGLHPDLGEAKLSEGSRKVLQKCNELDWAALSMLKLSGGQISEIQQFLHSFLILNLGRILPGRAGALDV